MAKCIEYVNVVDARMILDKMISFMLCYDWLWDHNQVKSGDILLL
jgi:hypothetical protein